jgi:ribose transport system permease protein
MTMSADSSALEGAPAPTRSWLARTGIDRFSALYLWAMFMLVFSFTSDQFMNWTSIRLVLTEKAIVGVLALAFLVPLAAETFDLSIGHMMGFSLVIVNVIARDYPSIPQGLGAVIAMVACGIVGFTSGFIVVKLRVNSFIATLGMSQVLAALTLMLSGNRQINGVLSSAYRDFGRYRILDLPLYLYFLVILAVVVWFVLEHTPTGRYLFATGANREAARLSGVNTDRYIWGSLVVSALIGGFAGLVQSWKVGTFGNSVGPGFLFPAVAAVFFGASQLRQRPNVWGTMIAVLTLAFGVKGLQLTFTGGNRPWIEPLFEGLSLLIAVAFASRQGIIKIPKRTPQKTEPAAATTSPGAEPASP